MKLDYNEILRYLGYEGELDNATKEMIDKGLEVVEKYASFKHIYRIYDLELRKNEIEFNNLVIPSRVLPNYFVNCKQILILGATLGLELDKQIKKLEITDMSLALVVNAVATEYMEKNLEKLCHDIEEDNKYYTSRFSIGYHDVSITHQPDLIKMIDATKLIGINVLESYLMVPSKSVSAMIGISDQPIEKQRAKCANCLPNGKCSFNCIREV
ncbi:MAG: vitamin B12 dependent-methionine synthase activation domain-containing protein [Erysipelotrichales bacterium]